MTQLSSTEYQQLCARTSAPITERVKNRSYLHPVTIKRLFIGLLKVAELANCLKGSVFYGKPFLLTASDNKSLFGPDMPFVDSELKAELKALLNLQELEIFSSDKMSERELRVLHAILGIASEIGELVEGFIKFDIVNLREELSDIDWYLSEGFNALGIDRSRAQLDNINKLQKRYPEKFTEKDAVERKDKIKESPEEYQKAEETPTESQESRNSEKTWVGSDHYKSLKIEPDTYIHANNLGFRVGSAIKYLSRYRFSKTSVTDLKKVIDYAKRLLKDDFGVEATITYSGEKSE